MEKKGLFSDELNIRALFVRIILVFLAGVIAVLTIAYISNNKVQEYAEINTTLNEILNNCGDQQTLSQYLSKNALILSNDSDEIESIANRLDSALGQFNRNHKALESLNAKLESYRTLDVDFADSLYALITPSLSSMIKSSYGIQEANNPVFFKGKILEHEEQFMPLMNQLVAGYQNMIFDLNRKLEETISNQYWQIGLTVIIAALSVLFFTLQMVRIRIETNRASFTDLFDSKKRYESLIHSTQEIIYELDDKGKFIYVNPAFKKLTGFSLKEANEKTWTKLISKDYRKELTDFYMAIVKDGEKSSYKEFPITTASGEERWLGQSTDFREIGKGLRIYNIARDITDLRLAALKEEKYRDGLRLLNELNAKSEQSIQERLKDGLKLCGEFLGLDVGIVSKIWMNEYSVVSFWPDDCGLEEQQKFRLGDTYCDITLSEKGKVLGIEDMGNSPHKTHPCFKNFKLSSYIGSAYRVGGKIAGTVNFTSDKARKNPFTDYEIDFIALVARWVGNLMDLQENRSKLLEEQNLLKTFVSRAPAAIAMLDKHMNYISASERWYKDQNIEGNIIGKSHYKVFPEIPRKWKEMHKRALSGEIVKPGMERFERQDGTVQWVQGEIHPWYTSKEKVGGIIIFTNDLTGIKKQELELRKAKEEAEVAGKIKEQFLSTMSHEIRTPLNAIIGTTHLLEMEHPELADNSRLKMLQFGSNNLLTLINDILDFQKIESGHLEIVDSDLNLRELIVNTIESWKAVPLSSKVALSYSYSNKLSDFYKGDEVRLTQVLNNLLSNALKFTEKGSVKLEVELSEDGLVQFVVKDTGIGIPKDKLETIFESFKQINNTHTQKAGGTGLGLSICKKLVDLMGGDLEVSSIEGKGTSFHFTASLGSSDVTESPVKVKKVAKADLNLKVLLVEDNLANQEIAKGFLNRWGVKVDVANNGKDAVKKIKSKGYDLMLIDVRMPVMDGYEATRKIRDMKDDYFRSIPIIALTASTLAESRSKMEKCGMDEIVSKPFDPDDLFEKVSRLGRKSIQDKKEVRVEIEEPKGSYFKFLTEVLGEDGDKVMMIASMAVKSISDDLKGSRDSLPDEDREKTYNYLHKMKSNLANLDLKELALKMPDYKSEHFWQNLPPYLDEVEVELEKLQIHLV